MNKKCMYSQMLLSLLHMSTWFLYPCVHIGIDKNVFWLKACITYFIYDHCSLKLCKCEVLWAVYRVRSRYRLQQEIMSVTVIPRHLGPYFCSCKTKSLDCTNLSPNIDLDDQKVNNVSVVLRQWTVKVVISFKTVWSCSQRFPLSAVVWITGSIPCRVGTCLSLVK